MDIVTATIATMTERGTYLNLTWCLDEWDVTWRVGDVAIDAKGRRLRDALIQAMVKAQEARVLSIS